ncbi:hypothetical protein PCE1_004008 [Barthelona sp. PCE]
MLSLFTPISKTQTLNMTSRNSVFLVSDMNEAARTIQRTYRKFRDKKIQRNHAVLVDYLNELEEFREKTTRHRIEPPSIDDLFTELKDIVDDKNVDMQSMNEVVQMAQLALEEDEKEREQQGVHNFNCINGLVSSVEARLRATDALQNDMDFQVLGYDPTLIDPKLNNDIDNEEFINKLRSRYIDDLCQNNKSLNDWLYVELATKT